MRYNLTDLQRYDAGTLQAELIAADITAEIAGHGKTSFNVTADDEAGADIVIQAHLAKSDDQHNLDIEDAEKDAMINQAIGQNRNIIKAIVKAINKGTLVTGADATIAELRTIIKEEM